MTDYHHFWGNAQKAWKTIDFKDSRIVNVLLVWAWIGMISFIVFGAFSALTKSNTAAILMILSMFVWLGCGISVVRIKRSRRKYLTVWRNDRN